MRKVLQSAGATVQDKQSKPSPQQPSSEAGKLMSLWTISGMALTNQIKVHTNPQKLLDRISTNQKAHKEKIGNSKPAQPERKEPGE
ncbi:hypothetical protein H4Q26_003285 [Puccinia striiformis f. sp. tritici PST-130]|nr:hypothetical protein H4Q26_003285 [Puccinia striiformis f. sp. tritici PST-130]